MTNNIEDICKKASEIILSYSEYSNIRVVSHYDADGISAAAIICKALYNAGFNFHATLMRNPFDKGLKRISEEENELVIFTDMGSGQIETIEKMKSQSIIIDHHQPIKNKTNDNVLQINCNHFGINGNYEACGATLSFSVAYSINQENFNLASLAIVGATGDKQYIGGFKGYNQKIINESIKQGIIREKTAIKLSSETIFDSLFYSIDPYYSGISGDKTNIDSFLDNIGIDEKTKTDDLTDENFKKIHSYLMLKLIQKGCEKNILDTVIRPRYYSENIGFEFERYADLLDACGKGGSRGIALSVALGDKKIISDALKVEKEYKQKILNELIKLEKEGFKEKQSFRFFNSDDSSLGGVIGGIATNFILDIKKPLLSLARKDGEIHISCRGNQYLVSKGLDLGYAMKEASTKLGGYGGGHAIASGATIADEKEEEFLNQLRVEKHESIL
jgi:single-stranded-DNA-specific exonuclease